MAKQKDFAQTQVRIPHELLEELKTSADKNFRSMKLAEPHATPEKIRRIIQEELAKASK